MGNREVLRHPERGDLAGGDVRGVDRDEASRGEVVVARERLHDHDVAAIVHVADRHRVGGDDGAAVDVDVRRVGEIDLEDAVAVPPVVAVRFLSELDEGEIGEAVAIEIRDLPEAARVGDDAPQHAGIQRRLHEYSAAPRR